MPDSYTTLKLKHKAINKYEQYLPKNEFRYDEPVNGFNNNQTDRKDSEGLDNFISNQRMVRDNGFTSPNFQLSPTHPGDA